MASAELLGRPPGERPAAACRRAAARPGARLALPLSSRPGSSCAAPRRPSARQLGPHLLAPREHRLQPAAVLAGQPPQGVEALVDLGEPVGVAPERRRSRTATRAASSTSARAERSRASGASSPGSSGRLRERPRGLPDPLRGRCPPRPRRAPRPPGPPRRGLPRPAASLLLSRSSSPGSGRPVDLLELEGEVVGPARPLGLVLASARSSRTSAASASKASR